ncbi:uncharacterized protein FPRO_04700 [Fusarium proliferatum ET1]|uniref:Uncharacterized protein n=1 Tax=Fusarium proliferatum (strain ET1) TaxID=1227346 RepID=A0A1L7VGN9_FUSPR|nr:uncharacterized protein FPRO_04700 [Fusarium proliferatum ET1]CZR39803.1 uncharacterized protein FPRO_04700 [Fusarium proliferatum ET1]
MNGIGVVLSFVITAAISVIVAVMAVLNRGISKQQYMRVDEKVLHWIGVRKPANESPSNLGYQSLLLALSDQMLAVGLCYLIAIPLRHCWLWHGSRLDDQMDDTEENDDNTIRRGETVPTSYCRVNFGSS